mmetsp:Transcript_19566/g.65723  ORF Transcript_19566/g.65723 Transcript_19566/m.65723 type:complete len:337 (-) Transcript_19566:495-1505(-)
MRALQAADKGQPFEIVTDRPAPTIEAPTDVIVRVHTAALNPVDWKMHLMGFYVKQWPHVFGCDMAGTVEAVGEEAKGSFKEGDKVWAYTDLGKAHSGAFAELVRVPVDVLGHVPEGMAMETAATLGVGFLTAAFMFYDCIDAADCPVLVYGASSSVGTLAVQLLAYEGRKIVAVASAAHHPALIAMGAVDAVDYRDGDWKAKAEAALKEAGEGAVALDAIGSKDTVEACVDIVKACGGSVVATTDQSQNTDGGEGGVAVRGCNLGTAYDDPRTRPLIGEYMEKAAAMLEAGALKGSPTDLLGGLADVAAGFDRMRAGKVSGVKLVVHVQEEAPSAE